MPQVPSGAWNLLRVIRSRRSASPWHRPHWQDIRRLFIEGIGTWIGGWGWRMFAASDGLVLAALGRPTQVAALACTNKLAQSLVQFSWIPCDNGLVGLAHLAGEQQRSGS